MLDAQDPFLIGYNAIANYLYPVAAAVTGGLAVARHGQQQIDEFHQSAKDIHSTYKQIEDIGDRVFGPLKKDQKANLGTTTSSTGSGPTFYRQYYYRRPYRRLYKRRYRKRYNYY